MVSAGGRAENSSKTELKSERITSQLPFLLCFMGTCSSSSKQIVSSTSTMSKDDDTIGFDTLCLHGAYKPDTSVTYGIGQGAPRGVPLYRTTPYQFVDTKHAAELFALVRSRGVLCVRGSAATGYVVVALLDRARRFPAGARPAPRDIPPQTVL